MANYYKVNKQDVLQLLMSHCDESSEIFLQSSVLVLAPKNASLYILCLCKRRSSKINGNKSLRFYTFNENNTQIKRVIIPKSLNACILNYYKIIINYYKNKTRTIRCLSIDHEFYCFISLPKFEKSSILLKFIIRDYKVYSLTHINSSSIFEDISLHKIALLQNKLQVIVFHDKKTKMYHASYDSLQDKFQITSSILYYNKNGKSALNCSIFHLTLNFVNVVSSTNKSSIFIMGICFNNNSFELIEYDKQKISWKKYNTLFLSPPLKTSFVSSELLIIDNQWLVFIEKKDGYLYRININTGQQIRTVFNLPSDSLTPSDFYQMRISQNKEIPQSKIVISFVQHTIKNKKIQNWPFALSLVCKSFYSNDSIQIINNGYVWNKYYLYSWLFPIDLLFEKEFE